MTEAYLSAIISIKKGYVSGFLILPTLKPTFKSLLRYKVFSQGGRGFPLPRELSLTPPPTQILFGTPAVGLYLVICLFCRRFFKGIKASHEIPIGNILNRCKF